MHAEYPQQIFPLKDSFAHGNFVLIMEMRKIAPNDGDVLSKNELFSFKRYSQRLRRLSNNLRLFLLFFVLHL